MSGLAESVRDILTVDFIRDEELRLCIVLGEPRVLDPCLRTLPTMGQYNPSLRSSSASTRTSFWSLATLMAVPVRTACSRAMRAARRPRSWMRRCAHGVAASDSRPTYEHRVPLVMAVDAPRPS